MTTTKKLHPVLRSAGTVITDAARLLEGEGFQRGHPGYGLPEALAEAGARDMVARVVAERWCVHNGLDVWWSDLLCIDGDDAAASLRGLGPIDAGALYGPEWEAQLGLFALAAGLTDAQLNGLANVTHSSMVRTMQDADELARAYDRGRLLDHCRQDVNFCTAHYATTPAGTARRLRAMLGLEGVAAYHVLHDKLSDEAAFDLTQPVRMLLLPIGEAY